MRLAAEDALAFVAGLDEPAFLASALHQSAVNRCTVIRNLDDIREAAGRVSKSL